VVQSIATFTLTCDHRAVDGVYGAKFLGRVKAIMESDELLEVCRL
jgi:pyruvate/2-oxoglutarate dehydrogenase complex dihydrolipoamide acyltransferase (E2) component